MNAVLLIDKPSGPTSHDVVARVRRILGERRCGHTGTLDPFATGLLILCLGRATRLARFVSDAYKSYHATIRFGFATDTYDRTGDPTTEIRDVEPARANLERVLSGFRGRQMQAPPAYSAKKRGGKRLYELARGGAPVVADPVEVEIDQLELVELRRSRAELTVRVSSGTYIRSLAHDIGVELGVGAHLDELRRTAVGSFSVAEAVDLDALEERGAGSALLAPEAAVRDLPSASVGGEAARRLMHGQPPKWDEVQAEWKRSSAPPEIRVLGPKGELLAVGEPVERGIRPLLVWGLDHENP